MLVSFRLLFLVRFYQGLWWDFCIAGVHSKIAYSVYEYHEHDSENFWSPWFVPWRSRRVIWLVPFVRLSGVWVLFFLQCTFAVDSDRKLRCSGNELSKHKASKSGSSSGYPSAAPEEPVCEETVTRCPCGSNVETGTMIQVYLIYVFFCLFFFNTATLVFAELQRFSIVAKFFFLHLSFVPERVSWWRLSQFAASEFSDSLWVCDLFIRFWQL